MNRAREPMIPPMKLERESRVPLHRQIYLEIARAIQSGLLQQEATLPASRTLAGILGVSRNTVMAAYDDLAADGLIRAKSGSGVHVNGGVLPGVSSSWMRSMLRSARYPQRVVSIADPDGNLLYLSF